MILRMDEVDVWALHPSTHDPIAQRHIPTSCLVKTYHDEVERCQLPIMNSGVKNTYVHKVLHATKHCSSTPRQPRRPRRRPPRHDSRPQPGTPYDSSRSGGKEAAEQRSCRLPQALDSQRQEANTWELSNAHDAAVDRQWGPHPYPYPWPPPSGAQTPLCPLCDIPSGCCSFTGPWTVTRSSLRMLRRVGAFCRPLRPVLLLASFPRSQSPVVGVLGLC